MDNPTRPLRGNRRPLASALTVAAAALFLLLGLGTPAVHAHAGLVGDTPTQDSKLSAAPRETALEFSGSLQQAHGHCPNEIRATVPAGTPIGDAQTTGSHLVRSLDITTNGECTAAFSALSGEDQPSATAPNSSRQGPEPRAEVNDTTGTGSDEEHRFLSPGLLGLAALVAAATIVGIFLTIRSRRRSRTNQETEE